MRLAAFIASLILVWPQIASGALLVVNQGVRQIEDGPLVALGTEFVPGETVYYSFQATGYTTAPGESETRKVRLDYEIDVFDPKGTRLVETVKSVLDTAISVQDKDWKPTIRSEFLLPHFAPPGKYKISVKLTDALTKASSGVTDTFEVSGHAVETSTELAVRNFGFYRSEDDQKPLSVAAYRAGDSLFARFDMTGFRYGDRNTIEVSYDVAVLNSESKAIYSQPNAAVEKSYSFYPKPSVPGGMSLSLQPNMRKGEYMVILTVHDLVGHQTFEMKQTFQVE